MGYKRIGIYFACIITSCVLTGCGAFTPEPPELESEEIEIEQPRYLLKAVGQVTSYEQDSGIILVRKYGQLNPKTQDVFITSGSSGNSANVKFPGQSNKMFASAELKSGSLAKGDIVYQRILNPDFVSELEKTTEGEQDPIIKDAPESDSPFSNLAY